MQSKCLKVVTKQTNYLKRYVLDRNVKSYSVTDEPLHVNPTSNVSSYSTAGHLAASPQMDLNLRQHAVGCVGLYEQVTHLLPLTFHGFLQMKAIILKFC